MDFTSKHADVALLRMTMKQVTSFRIKIASGFQLLLLLLPMVLTAKPLRVISLSPSTTELAYEAGLGDNLIAVSEHSDYPPEALKLERVANYRGINIERVITLKPDLVLAWKCGNSDKELAKLASFGITLFYSNPHSLYDTADNIENLGKWSDNPEKAKARADSLRLALKTREDKQKDKIKIPYFYQLSSTPLMTNNAKNWPEPLFALCGGENIFATSPASYPMVGIEQIILKKPSAIFYSKDTPFPSGLEKWGEFIPAVKLGNIFAISGDWLNRPTPRALQAADQICDALDKVRRDLAH